MKGEAQHEKASIQKASGAKELSGGQLTMLGRVRCMVSEAFAQTKRCCDRNGIRVCIGLLQCVASLYPG